MLKFYETHFEEYVQATRSCNLHPELEEKIEGFPKKWEQMNNMIIYGPPGIGKYSQALAMIRRYSPSELKYEKKITVQTEKQNYIYHISDIHYEIDMSLLGCNSKILWNEIFLQIVDIVSVKPEKIGIVMCKQFQSIHSELLDIFYSYIQQYNNVQSPIQLKFIILTEHLSFIPNNILGSCYLWSIERPSKELYKKALNHYKYNTSV
jgi:DNA polymerase III delta prime subunit